MDQQNPLTQERALEAAGKPRGWPVQFDWLRYPSYSFSAPATAVLMSLLFLLILFSLVAVLRLGFGLVYGSSQEALEASRVLLPLSAAAVGLPLIIWRLVILNRQTKTAEEKTQIDRETHYTSIFSKSVEQLGATREQKEASDSRGQTEVRVQTVPNIEMRLGGIHSLSRLAEESKRDAPKIENTLLSYVRENSWYGRDGAQFKRLTNTYNSRPNWLIHYDAGDITSATYEMIAKWQASNSETVKEVREWAATLPETRVDVAEAIAAASQIETETKGPLAFQESLFVGRVITADLTQKYDFNRSVFVRCEFDIKHSNFCEIKNSILIDCRLDLSSSRITLRDCSIFNLETWRCSNSDLLFVDSHIYGYEFWASTEDARLVFECSLCKDMWLFTGSLISDFHKSTFYDCNFSSINFASGSKIYSTNFIDCSFYNSDLSKLEQYDNASLQQMSVSSMTLHPGDVRPPSWPSYGAETDEIPF